MCAEFYYRLFFFVEQQYPGTFCKLVGGLVPLPHILALRHICWDGVFTYYFSTSFTNLVELLIVKGDDVDYVT